MTPTDEIEELAFNLYNQFRCPCGQSHIEWKLLKPHQRRYWDKKAISLIKQGYRKSASAEGRKGENGNAR